MKYENIRVAESIYNSSGSGYHLKDDERAAAMAINQRLDYEDFLKTGISGKRCELIAERNGTGKHTQLGIPKKDRRSGNKPKKDIVL